MSWNSQHKITSGYLYIVKCHAFYKIGYAFNFDGRVRNLQVGNPYQLSLVLVKELENVKDIEQRIHDLLAQKKVRGEWFRLDKYDWAIICKEIGEYEQFEEKHKELLGESYRKTQESV